MGQRLAGFLDNNSIFGQIMTRCGILIAANLMFVIFSFPVITIGPSLAALYYVMLRTLQSRDGVINPFKEFWRSFRMNLKQGMISGVAFLALAAVLVLDIRFCAAAGGIFTYFKFALYVTAGILAVLAIYLYPVMAAFSDTLPGLLRNAVFFASRRPHKIILLALLYAVPVLVTALDVRMRPLYGFLWITCGCSILAMAAASLLWKDIREYLPPQEAEAQPEEKRADRKPDREILKEMKKLQ